MICFVVKPKLIGTCYGILGCSVNLAAVVLNPGIGRIHDKTDDYVWVEGSFIALCSLSLVLKYSLWRWDKNNRDGLL